MSVEASAPPASSAPRLPSWSPRGSAGPHGQAVRAPRCRSRPRQMRWCTARARGCVASCSRAQGEDCRRSRKFRLPVATKTVLRPHLKLTESTSSPNPCTPRTCLCTRPCSCVLLLLPTASPLRSTPALFHPRSFPALLEINRRPENSVQIGLRSTIGRAQYGDEVERAAGERSQRLLPLTTQSRLGSS